MPTYAYRARTVQGRLAQGIIDAQSEAELAHRLDARGLILTTTRQVKAARKSRKGLRRLSRRELIALTYNLETIFSSGIPLVEGLQDLAKNAGNKQTSAAAEALAKEIESGSSLAEAMSRHPKAFPTVYRSVVNAGEAAGEPGPLLKRVAEYYQWLADIRATALRALMYPAILAGAIGCLIMLLLTFLVPRVLMVLVRAKAEIPLPTKIIMSISGFLGSNLLMIALSLILAVTGFLLFRRATKGRWLLDTLKLRLPIFGPLIAKIAAARFANTLSTLYRAGIGTVESLEAAEQVTGNAIMAAGVRSARDDVLRGQTLAESLARAETFQPLVVRMVRLGEQTGTLGEAFDRINSFYDREIPQTIKSILNLLEPAMIVCSGLVVGFILLCTFLPIFEMVNSLGR